MSVRDSRELVSLSPARARSLLTVRAAISSALSSDLPCSSWLSLMCSYWRARFVPGFTPRGGIDGSLRAGGTKRLPASRTAHALATTGGPAHKIVRANDAVHQCERCASVTAAHSVASCAYL